MTAKCIFIRRLKKQVYLTLDASDNSTKLSKIFNYFLIAFICLNVTAVCLETVDTLYQEYKQIFDVFEVLSVSIFTLEFILRLWAITADKRYERSILGRLRFMLTFEAMIDLLAILPFYLPLLIGFDLRFIRILRLFRLLRILKMSRYMHATKMIANVFKSKKEELGMILLLIVFMVVVISSVMYNVEHGEQYNKEHDNFASIPATMWWSVATLTSVSNDIKPVSSTGKTLASIISILGIMVVALPVGVVASGFMEELKKKNGTSERKCPHCGK